MAAGQTTRLSRRRNSFGAEQDSLQARCRPQAVAASRRRLAWRARAAATRTHTRPRSHGVEPTAICLVAVSKCVNCSGAARYICGASVRRERSIVFAAGGGGCGCGDQNKPHGIDAGNAKHATAAARRPANPERERALVICQPRSRDWRPQRRRAGSAEGDDAIECAAPSALWDGRSDLETGGHRRRCRRIVRRRSGVGGGPSGCACRRGLQAAGPGGGSGRQDVRHGPAARQPGGVGRVAVRRGVAGRGGARPPFVSGRPAGLGPH